MTHLQWNDHSTKDSFCQATTSSRPGSIGRAPVSWNCPGCNYLPATVDVDRLVKHRRLLCVDSGLLLQWGGHGRHLHSHPRTRRGAMADYKLFTAGDKDLLVENWSAIRNFGLGDRILLSMHDRTRHTSSHSPLPAHRILDHLSPQRLRYSDIHRNAIDIQPSSGEAITNRQMCEMSGIPPSAPSRTKISLHYTKTSRG